MLIAVGLAVVVLLTLATGYFVAQEFAYVSVDRNRLRQLADEGDAAAARALDITDGSPSPSRAPSSGSPSPPCWSGTRVSPSSGWPWPTCWALPTSRMRLA